MAGIKEYIMELKNLEIKKYQLFSIAFFGLFLIGMFFPWFDATGLKTVQGTLVLSSLFPAGIVAVILFFGINFIAIIRKSSIFIHGLNLLPLAALALLTVRIFAKYDEMPLGYGFYISTVSLALAFLFCFLNVLCFEGKNNESIPLDDQTAD